MVNCRHNKIRLRFKVTGKEKSIPKPLAIILTERGVAENCETKTETKTEAKQKVKAKAKQKVKKK